MNGDPGDLLAIGLVFAFYLAGIGVVLFGLVSVWRILEKGGRPGWPALVPIYGAMQLLGLVGLPVWWLILLLLPGVNLVAFVVVGLALARSFRKGGGYAVGLALLPVVFLAILAFGSAQYQPRTPESEYQKSLSKP